MCEGDVPCEPSEGDAPAFPTSTLIAIVAGLAALLGLGALVRCVRKRPQTDEVKPAPQATVEVNKATAGQ